ncbi:Integrase recombinase xerD-like, partial [Paramuricea clavata]
MARNVSCRFVYLDDGISGHKQRLDAVAASIIHKNNLTLSGLVANDEKCHWEPMQVGEWLGHFEIPPRKIEKAKKNIESVLSSKCISYRELAKIAGFINSLYLAVGPSVRLFTRQLFYTISQRGSWSDYVTDIPPLLVEKLRFWLTNLGCLNGYSMTPKVSAEPLYIYTDASSFGYGGYLASSHEFKAQGHWTLQQKVKSSTFRELLAILQVLKVFLKHLEHKRIKVFSDSQSACRIVLVGSRVPELQHIAVENFNLCFFSDIQIESQWIPRTQNQIADALSKATDLDDWQLQPQLFNLLHAKWGPFSIDRFASSHNKQLPRFNSRFWCPDAEAVDCFTQNWSNDTNWLCPPVSLVIPTIPAYVQLQGFAINILFIDVDLDEFRVGVWKDCLQIQDPSLLRLALSLPKVVLSAKAQTTTSHYAYAWNRWKTWSKSKLGVAYLPAQP